MTETLIVAVIVSLIAYDLYAYRQSGPDATITHVVRDWCRRYPPIAVIFGVLIDHLFLK